MMTPEEYRDQHWDECPFWEEDEDQEEDVEFDDEEEE